MQLVLSEIPKKLNKAYLKQDLNRDKIEIFKSNLKILFSKAEIAESKKEHEEHFKNIVSDFLKDTWYKNNYEININKRKDLVIHNGKSSSDSIAVIIEAKKPSNETEMISEKAPNAKALQELMHYYLHERIINNNKDIKHIIATNSYDWYIFDAASFEKHFYENKSIRKNYEEWHSGSSLSSNTDWFYNEIAKPFIETELKELEAIHFNLLDYKEIIENSNPADDDKLINLYKILSPEHLLKKPFANDSNSLNKEFYNELLHIIGLEERPDGGKKLIDRKKPEKRDDGSLLENTIRIIESRNRQINLSVNQHKDSTPDEEVFSIALELCITWLNRILFLKLLEGQLIKYHNGNPDYAFINSKNIKDFDELDELFFEVLAINTKDRSQSVNEKYGIIPYLNSSLFEPSDLEQKYTFINSLKDRLELPIYAHSVLKNKEENKGLQKKLTLHYLFEFLEAYNFSSDSSAKIQEDNKSIINASVLGLIFEKINGYKDGSIFTPGFITMYMCHETIRRSVAQKFKELENAEIETFDDVKKYCARFFKKEDIARFNKIINSLKIIDIAVGSGHFLVSALNELIAIKSELNILVDNEGTPLEYEITVDNDELSIISKKTNKPFEYILGHDNKPPRALQQVQVTLFNEKQTIIENCLFGVDINPKSVLICRLRLWIELLKNAYYKFPSIGGVSEVRGGLELETLPNIDINIKCGNSLISRYPLDTNIKQLLRSSKWTIETYRLAISSYRNAKNKDEKYAFEELILKIKQEFSHEIRSNDPLKTRLDKLSHELYNRFTGNFLFESEMSYGKKEKELEKKKKAEQKKLEDEINAITKKINEIKDSVIYKNALEWRFEFPEVLDDEGNFIGFDVVIGNPPYGVKLDKNEDQILRNTFKVSNYQIDTYIIFTERGNNLLNENGNLIFIIPNAWYSSIYDIKFRQYLIENNLIESITECPKNTFEEAVVETCILQTSKKSTKSYFEILDLQGTVLNSIEKSIIKTDKKYSFYVSENKEEQILRSRILEKFSNVNDFFDVIWGVKVYQIGKGIPLQNGTESKYRLFHSDKKMDEYYKPFIGGSNISPYFIKWDNTFVKYGSWLAEPRKPEWFLATPRIVVREITAKGHIYAALIEDEYVFSNSVDGIRSKNNNREHLLQLLGILNSKFAAYLNLKSSSNAQKDSFPKVLIQNLRDFPFVPEINKALIIKVSQIIEQKNNNPIIDTTHLEKEIDQLVYQLYGLTDEEIGILEGA